MEEINKHIDQIKALCSSHKVKTLFAFGSAVKNELKESSDIDFIIEINDNDPLSYSDKYFAIKFQLEQLFNRNIDLLEFKAIQNKFLIKEIEATKRLIYGE